ncbi:MAG: NUDIX domain-containing protein [Sphingobacteriales bacterium]|nr:NUDIX domain-containing protein [Sphingobacteriales bacterium]
MLKYFNVRVYGILLNEAKQVLVSDERIYNRNLEITKFPGGGLELGEGTLDCIKREFKEELNIDIEIVKHLYTTDFFQQSAFHDDHQIISIYYIVKPIMPLFIPVNNGLPEYPDKVGEIFRFIDWDFFNEDIMSLPIDKIALKILKNEY